MNRVFGGQGDAAECDHKQDDHLKVTHVDNVVTQAPETAEAKQRSGRGKVKEDVVVSHRAHQRDHIVSQKVDTTLDVQKKT